MNKKWIKAGTAAALSAAMVLGIMPNYGINNVYADDTIPVNEFATTAQLMSEFDTDLDTAGKTLQKVIFGQNGSSGNQEWLIVGKDTGVSGDNIILFANSPLKRNQNFNLDGSAMGYKDEWGCTYESAPIYVNINHYGGSDLRSILQEIEGDTNYFSSVEQAKMNSTTITTADTRNSTTYTTTDKLYAAHGVQGEEYITVGTNQADSLNNGLKINDGIRNISTMFWLRSVHSSYNNMTNSYYSFNGANRVSLHAVSTSTDMSVTPAFNLSLSTVNFASVAPTATTTGELTKAAAFTLRYKPQSGDTLNSRSVRAVIDADKQSVNLTETTAGMYLMVQNSDGVYAVDANGKDEVNASDITIGGNALTDFSNCKVWLEHTDANRITTAKYATQGLPTEITSVAITNITAPVAGQTFDTIADTENNGVLEATATVSWSPKVDQADYDTTYTASVILTPESNQFEFTDTTTATVDGEEATVVLNDDGTITVSYQYTTEKEATPPNNDGNTPNNDGNTPNNDGNTPNKDGTTPNKDGTPIANGKTNTGDNTSVGLFLGLGLLSVLGYTYITRKKEEV